MTAIFAWSFPRFDVAPTSDGLDNVVKAINWILEATDGKFRATAYGSAAMDDPDPNNFTPYSQITKEWAIANVSTKLDVPKVQEALEQQIEAQRNPPVLPMVPPFASLKAAKQI